MEDLKIALSDEKDLKTYRLKLIYNQVLKNPSSLYMIDRASLEIMTAKQNREFICSWGKQYELALLAADGVLFSEKMINNAFTTKKKNDGREES